MAKQARLSVQRGRLTDAPDSVARDLGWFSIGLGLAELLAPRAVARMVGMRWTAPLLTLCGMREIATGVGLLAGGKPDPWLWGRVGGDALDLSLLGLGVLGAGRSRGRAALAFLAVAGVAALDVLAAQTQEERRRRASMRAFDYSDRSGLPRPPEMMRGAARQPPEARRVEAPRTAAL